MVWPIMWALNTGVMLGFRAGEVNAEGEFNPETRGKKWNRIACSQASGVVHWQRGECPQAIVEPQACKGSLDSAWSSPRECQVALGMTVFWGDYIARQRRRLDCTVRALCRIMARLC